MGKNDDPSVDYYAVLGVARNAHPEVIKAAYYALIDKVGEEELEVPLSLVREAFRALNNTADREAYDLKKNQTGVVIGNNRVDELIYDDGLTKTYGGIYVPTNEPVRLKHGYRISARNNKLLVEEAKILSNLRHNSILPARELLEREDGSLILVTSDLKGGFSLEQAVAIKGRLDVVDIVWVTERILNLLSYLRIHGCINGSIAPQYILIQQDHHEAALSNFGLFMVKPEKDSRSKGYITNFSPPEQINMSGPLLPESDLYSLGLSMIYALNGGDLEALKKHEVPQDVPGPLSDFIGRLVCDDVEDRLRWEEHDVFDLFLEVREMSVGCRRSGMKKIIP